MFDPQQSLAERPTEAAAEPHDDPPHSGHPGVQQTTSFPSTPTVTPSLHVWAATSKPGKSRARELIFERWIRGLLTSGRPGGGVR